MLAVLLVGAPRSLWIGIIAAGIGMFVGIILGFTAGFMGGWVDTVIRVISDSVITIPSLAVLIVISAFVSFNNITYMALMLALFAWPGPTRLIRSQVLSMREQGYVQMARLSGASVFSIMFGEMMPNLLPYLAASFTGNVSGAILAATGLEVLGLGPTRIPTLGITIFYAIRAAAILRGMWWWWGTPIVALIVIFSGLFLMTIGLDEIANPRLRGVKAAMSATVTHEVEISVTPARHRISDDEVALDIKGLKVYYATPTGDVRAVDDVDLKVYEARSAGSGRRVRLRQDDDGHGHPAHGAAAGPHRRRHHHAGRHRHGQPRWRRAARRPLAQAGADSAGGHELAQPDHAHQQADRRRHRDA